MSTSTHGCKGTVTLTIYRRLDVWRWRLQSGNHKIIDASTEAFVDRKGCDHNADLVLGPHTRRTLHDFPGYSRYEVQR